MAYQSKDSVVLGRQLKTQKVSIPLTITGHATPASVVITRAEPTLLYVLTEGVDQVTAALATDETATYAVAADDSDGIFNLLLDVKETVRTVISVRLADMVTGVNHPVKLGSATGITTGDGSTGKIMITCDSATNLATSAVVTATLEVEYILSE